MKLVTIPDIDQGEITLQELPLDATLGSDGAWKGVGADILNVAIDEGYLPWPRRIDEVWVLGGDIWAGYPHPKCGILDQAAIAYRESHWPVALRQTYIPPVVTFWIEAKPGSRITGHILVEQQ